MAYIIVIHTMCKFYRMHDKFLKNLCEICIGISTWCYDFESSVNCCKMQLSNHGETLSTLTIKYTSIAITVLLRPQNNMLLK